MTPPSSIALDFARVLVLLRDHPEAKEEQKSAFRILVTSLGVRALHLRADTGGLSVDGVPAPRNFPGLDDVLQQMVLHGVGELQLPNGLAAAPLLSTLRALAVPPGSYGHIQDFIEQIGEPGASQIKVSPLPTPMAGVPQGSAAPPSGAPAPNPNVVRAAAKPGDPMNEEGAGLMHFLTKEFPAVGRLEELAAAVQNDPSNASIPNLLSDMVAACDRAAEEKEWIEILKAAAIVVRCEQKVPQGAMGRSYGINLRRMLPRTTLEEIARAALKGIHRDDAQLVLTRMGASSTEVLLGLLMAAPTLDERRGYFDALTRMSEGTDLVVNMLTHNEWYVVRNIAELCGELRLEAAVPNLARQMSHADERARRAVAGALAKIGTNAAIEPLRKALQDPTPAVRLRTVMAVDAKSNRALALRLITLLDEESDDEVLREMLLALGRVGSAEAVQALAKRAAPGGKILNRKSATARVAAVEGLRLAGTDAAIAVLKELAGDGDSEVREAVVKALKAAVRKR